MFRLALSVLLPLIAAGLVLSACGDDGAQSFAEACQPSDEQQFSEPPARIIDTSKSYVATIKTAKGDIQLELFSDVPNTTNNFVFLACKGFYDGTTFHQVVPGFIAQGGDPKNDCTGGPGYAIPDEPDGSHIFDPGALSMAKPEDRAGNARPNSAGSQFFITYTSQPRLEQDFTVFGRILGVASMATLQRLTPRQCAPGDVIQTITIEERDGATSPDLP